MRRPAIHILLLASWFATAAQERCTVAFYNTENFFDTLRSPFYDDGDYTPQGRLRWDTERYLRKLSRIGEVIDTIGADLVALAEVENEQVVRDLVGHLRTDYNYIHRTSSDYRGMDLALLYKGDRFFPRRAELIPCGSGREALYVRGDLRGARLDLIVCHLPSQLNPRWRRERALGLLARIADSLRRADPQARIAVIGDLNASPTHPLVRRHMPEWLRPLLAAQARSGQGTIVHEGRWQLFDNVFCDSSFREAHARICIFDRLLCPADGAAGRLRAGHPLRTFSSGGYAGGYSDHLPVLFIFRADDRTSAER